MSDTTDLGEIIVIGRRKRPTTTLPPQMIERDPVTGEIIGGGGGGRPVTQAQADAENKRQEECAAKKAKEKLDAEQPFAKDKKEFFTFIWDRNGDTAIHPLRGGDAAVITQSEFNQARTDFGIQPNQIRGMVHNHPSDVYCGSDDRHQESYERAVNSYPSTNDWRFAESLGPTVTPNLTLYVIGCDGQVRAFPYSERVTFEAQAAQVPPRTPTPVAPNCP